MVLMEIYGSFEGRPADGVRVGEQLARAYPDNPSVQFALAELYLGPAVEDPAKAAAQYENVIASESKRAEPQADALYQAQLGLASALFQQWRGGEAVRVLSATIDARPSAPAWVMPTFLLRRANYRALLGDGGADGDVQRVLAEPTWKDRHKNANDLVTWMAQRRASGDAAVYAALIPGNRLVRSSDGTRRPPRMSGAARSSERSAAAVPAGSAAVPAWGCRRRVGDRRRAGGGSDGAGLDPRRLAADGRPRPRPRGPSRARRSAPTRRWWTTSSAKGPCGRRVSGWSRRIGAALIRTSGCLPSGGCGDDGASGRAGITQW